MSELKHCHGSPVLLYDRSWNQSGHLRCFAAASTAGITWPWQRFVLQEFPLVPRRCTGVAILFYTSFRHILKLNACRMLMCHWCLSVGWSQRSDEHGFRLNGWTDGWGVRANTSGLNAYGVVPTCALMGGCQWLGVGGCLRRQRFCAPRLTGCTTPHLCCPSACAVTAAWHVGWVPARRRVGWFLLV